MIFKKKKFYICVVAVLALIVIAAASVFIFPVEKQPIVNVEGEADAENPEYVEPDIPEEEEGEVGGDEKVEENLGSQLQQTNITFTNAWTAVSYALKMFEKHPCYIYYYQKIDGAAKGYPVTVDAKITRKIYNNVSEIYVVNKPNTKVDVANLGIDFQIGSTFESHTYFDINNNVLYNERGEASDLSAHKAHHVLTTYDLPYLINKKTADTIGGLITKKDYYEVQLKLKEPAYEKYVAAMKNNIGLTEIPKMSKAPILTIRIDKKTGTFKSISSVEEVKTNYTYSSITAPVVATSTLTLTFDYNANVAKKVAEFKKSLNIN